MVIQLKVNNVLSTLYKEYEVMGFSFVNFIPEYPTKKAIFFLNSVFDTYILSEYIKKKQNVFQLICSINLKTSTILNLNRNT